MRETLSLRRDLYVPRELVFEVWTEPEHLVQWYPPDSDLDPTAAVNLRVGGSYALSWQTADATRWRQSGEYTIVEPPARLAYSAILAAGAEPQVTTGVTIELTDVGGSTRIVVTETGWPDSAYQTQLAQWQLRLDRLEAYFSVV